MDEETPRERRSRFREERRQALAADGADRLDQARSVLNAQRAERRARRAPAMSVEDRRAAIVEAALPLLIEHGANVTTSQIAAAAGIAEGTVFRAFGDKNALFIACLHAALESDTALRRIRSIDRTLPLDQRLAQAVDNVTEYQQQLWSVVQAVHAAGIDPHWPRPDENESEAKRGMPQAMVWITDAIAELFEPDIESMRIQPEAAAGMLLGLTFHNRLREQGFGGAVAETPELVDLFLHGTLRSQPGGRNSND